MVDKLRKAGLWVWYFKERILLLVMVGALAFQVYQLLNPAPPEASKPLPAPRREMAEDVDPSIRPPQPGPVPQDTGAPETRALVDRNPYWYYSSTGESKGSDEVPADLIQLVKIQKIGERVRCQLRTKTTTKWYEQGDKFEEFTLEAIDPVANTATVFVESYGKRVDLSPQG